MESVTVPVNVASCAYATRGSSKIPEERSSRLTILNVMTSLTAVLIHQPYMDLRGISRLSQEGVL